MALEADIRSHLTDVSLQASSAQAKPYQVKSYLRLSPYDGRQHKFGPHRTAASQL